MAVVHDHVEFEVALVHGCFWVDIHYVVVVFVNIFAEHAPMRSHQIHIRLHLLSLLSRSDQVSKAVFFAVCAANLLLLLHLHLLLQLEGEATGSH